MSPRTVEQNEVIREQRKAQIAEAAFHVFAQNGYAATSMAQVAKKAEVSKGLLYNYFESKESLLEHLFHAFVHEADAFWQPDENRSPKENLKSLLDTTFFLMVEHKQLSRLISQLALQNDVIGNLADHTHNFIIEKVRQISSLLAKMGVDDPEDEAMFLGTFLDGMGFDILVIGDDYPLEKMKHKIYNRYNLI